MRRHQLKRKKSISIQVVGSETIGEYRLMGFNDLRTAVELDLGISARIDLYRPLNDRHVKVLLFTPESIAPALPIFETDEY